MASRPDTATAYDKQTSPSPPVLYLIDGHAQFFRAYFAMRSRMTSPVTGEPTNLTYTFTAMLLKLLRDEHPEYLAVVIDAAGDRETFRSEIYPEYKANREPPPDDFRPQVERCLQLLEQLRIPIIAEEGVEADDVIASLIRTLTECHPNLRIRIVSRDKDLTQLISDRVEMFDAMKDQVVTPAELFQTEGVEPKHVADILSLMGDTVDNIPGVPGIGPKTAAKLILQYGSLENLLEHVHEIKGKRRENIEAARELLSTSRQLVALRDTLTPDFTLEDARNDLQLAVADEFIATLRDLGFNRHEQDFRALIDGDSERKDPSATGTARNSPSTADRRDSTAGADSFGGLFDTVASPASLQSSAITTPALDAWKQGDYVSITDPAALQAWIVRIKEAGRFAVDTETDGISPISARLVGISLAIEPHRASYIPIRSPEPATHMDEATVIELLRPLLESDGLTRIGHNLKFDMNVFRTHGITLKGELFDTMTASYVIDATRSSHRMDVLARAFLDRDCIPITDLLGRGRHQRTFDQVPLDLAAPYAAEDADVTLQLSTIFERQISEMQLTTLFRDVEMPLVNVLADMEYNGIRVDPEELKRQKDGLSTRIAALRQNIIDAAPHPFNPDSPSQLAQVLFSKPDADPPGLGLRALKRGKTGPSTDVEVLEKLAAEPAVESLLPDLMLEYRQLTKLVNTYLDSLRDAINHRTGRVHASFHQTGTATGRLSSSDPNLQNIPIRTEIGREIRRAFVAEAGCVLLTADYSQIELRMLAHLSGDAALISAFESGEDIHTAVAAEVFATDPDDVTGEQRASAKMVNFGIIYGITAYGLARRLGPDVSVKAAQQIIDDYKQRFASIDAFLDACVRQAIEHGYVETILGRRRAIPQITDSNAMQRSLGERMAINTVVQGSAADLIKLAMINLHRALPERVPAARLVLQIHDELVLEVPESQASDLRTFVVEVMQHAMELRVPLVVQAAFSHNWIDAK